MISKVRVKCCCHLEKKKECCFVLVIPQETCAADLPSFSSTAPIVQSQVNFAPCGLYQSLNHIDGLRAVTIIYLYLDCFLVYVFTACDHKIIWHGLCLPSFCSLPHPQHLKYFGASRQCQGALVYLLSQAGPLCSFWLLSIWMLSAMLRSAI